MFLPLSRKFWTAEYDEQRDLVIMRRQAQEYSSVDEIRAGFDEMIAVTQRYRGKPAMTDLRLARGNNNPEWEAILRPLVTRLNLPFSPRAVVCGTAAGKLQLQRLCRERGDTETRIFTDEA